MKVEPEEGGLSVRESGFLLELKGDLPMLLEAVLPELSNEEEATSLLVAGEAPKEEDLDIGLGLGTIRELKGAFDTGAPLPAVFESG